MFMYCNLQFSQPDTVVIVLGNKCDREERRQVPTATAEQVLTYISFVVHLFPSCIYGKQANHMYFNLEYARRLIQI